MNLEEYFETKNSQDFPSEKDYVAIYRTFKQFMNSEIHNEVKAITTRLDNTVYKEIRKTVVKAPVEEGSVLIPDVLGLGIDVIATKRVEKKQG